MKKLGVLVGENQNWTFFREIFEDLSKHFEVSVFRERVFQTPLLHGRLNRWSHRHGIRSILRQSDIACFEWASQLLVTASHMEKFCPIVTRLHSFELHEWAPRVNWEHVDQIILVSEAMRRNFIREHPQYAAKTTVVYNGVSLEEFRPGDPSAGVELGMIASIIPRKRIYEVILALPELLQRGCEFRLHIAGEATPGAASGQYFAACQRLVKELGLERRVIFTGRVSATAEWLRGIDIFISNSFWEGQQVALLEALASGCYCLSHTWDGAEEVLPASQLFTLPQDLIDKIIEYSRLSYDEKLDRRRSSRTIAEEKFDHRRQHSQIRQIMEETLGPE